jgi:hypothetical protein
MVKTLNVKNVGEDLTEHSLNPDSLDLQSKQCAQLATGRIFSNVLTFLTF